MSMFLRTASLCGLLFVLLVPAQAVPGIGDEIIGLADVEFELVFKKATLTPDGHYAAKGKLRFQGQVPDGDVLLGKGNVRIREVFGFNPLEMRKISGSGVLRFQGGISEIYGDGSYDLNFYGELLATIVEAKAFQGVMQAKSIILVGSALVRPATAFERALATD